MSRSQEGKKRLEKLTNKLILFFVNTCLSIPRTIAQLYIERDEMCTAIVLDVCTAFVCFK